MLPDKARTLSSLHSARPPEYREDRVLEREKEEEGLSLWTILKSSFGFEKSRKELWFRDQSGLVWFGSSDFKL